MSEVTICNLALSHIGDTAAVTSIKPPDGSVQARLCAQFYEAARDALLEMGSWGFSTKRVQLAQVTSQTFTDADGNSTQTWQFAYAVPSDMVNAIAVLDPDAADDYEQSLCTGDPEMFPPFPQGFQPVPGAPEITPQPFVLETLPNGTQVLLTNVCDAVLRYTGEVTDTTAFSPLFTLALSYLLASMLAGPIIKGDEGSAKATQMLEMFESIFGKASASDANQRKVNLRPATPWIRGR